MDRYILLINGENLPEIEQKIFVDYLNSSLLSEEQRNYNAKHSGEINLLIPRKPLSVACITASSDSRKVHCEWNEVSDCVKRETIFKECISDNSSQSNAFDGNVSRSVAQVIHALADQLPSHGTYYLDVLLSCDLLEDADISDHICLMGALQRLRMWHCSLIYGVLGTKETNDYVKQWCDMLGAYILSDETPKYSAPVLWRGRIEVTPEEKNVSDEAVQHECELRLFSQNPFPSFSKLPLVKSDVDSKDKEGGWKLSLTSYMEVIDECQLSTIPLYMFSPPVMQLYFLQENNANDSSPNVMSYLSTKPDVALIFRLKYDKLAESSMCNDIHTTEKWKKAVMSGKVNSMRHSILDPTGHFTFVAAKRSCHDSVITVYHLCPTNETINVLCDMLKMTSIPSRLNSPETAANINAEKFFGIPHLDHNLLQRCIETIEELSSEKILLEWMNGSKSDSSNSVLTVADAASIFNEVVKIIFSKLKHQSKDEQNRSTYFNNEQISDSWDWPERLFLFKQKMDKEQGSKHESAETASNFAPLFILNNAAVISIKDIGKCFKETGESNNENVEVMYPQNVVTYLPTSDSVTEISWPKIMSYKYHDVYYNTDVSVKHEIMYDDEVQKDFLLHETASMCCNQRIVLNCSLSSQNSSPPAISKKKARKRNHSSSKPGIQRADNKLLRLASDNTSCASASSVEGDSKQREHVKSKSSRLFNSRKLSSDFTQTKVQRPKKLQTNSIFAVHDDLEERHKLKLRAAVMFALEKYDITEKHTLFKPCARKLFAVCKPFVQDIAGKGNTTSRLKVIAGAHAKQVVDFETQNSL